MPVSDGGAKIYSPVSIASNLIPSFSKNTVYAASKTAPVNSAPQVSRNCKSDKRRTKISHLRGITKMQPNYTRSRTTNLKMEVHQ